MVFIPRVGEVFGFYLNIPGEPCACVDGMSWGKSLFTLQGIIIFKDQTNTDQLVAVISSALISHVQRVPTPFNSTTVADMFEMLLIHGYITQ